VKNEVPEEVKNEGNVDGEDGLLMDGENRSSLELGVTYYTPGFGETSEQEKKENEFKVPFKLPGEVDLPNKASSPEDISCNNPDERPAPLAEEPSNLIEA